MSIEKELKNRILVLDSAMGTMLQAYKFTEEDFREEQLALLKKVLIFKYNYNVY